MSWAYRLLGLAQSTPEFVEGAKARGITRADVKTAYSLREGPGGERWDGYALRTLVTAGRTSLANLIYVGPMPDDSPRPIEQDARRHSVQESLEWARSLQERGLEVTIDGTNPEDVKDI